MSTNGTPRGSWASSIFDLRNSLADNLIPSLLDRVQAQDIDKVNEARRKEGRHTSFFTLYPAQDEVQYFFNSSVFVWFPNVRKELIIWSFL